MQRHLVDASLPFCAFNGGADVFVDVGNKSLGLEALMAYMGFTAPQVHTMDTQPRYWILSLVPGPGLTPSS